MNPIRKALVYLMRELIASLSVQILDTAENIERFRGDFAIAAALKARITDLKQKKAELEELLEEVEHGCPNSGIG